MDRRRRHCPSRAGFTLIEVLIAILIVGLLIAILLPAVQAAFRRAREAQATAEINNLATALADFKQKFGDYPPSRIIVCEGGYNAIPAGVLSSQVPGAPASGPNNLADTDMTYSALVARSALYLNKFWPRANFYGSLGNTPGTFHDFNGNGSFDADPYIISGSECLVFFLGGMPSVGTGGRGLTGFSRSPILPFVDLNRAPNRSVPFYEFVGGRLADLDHDGIPAYLDVFSDSPTNSVPYAFFSAYGSNAYDPNDINDNGHSNSYAGNTPTYSAENIELDEAYPTPYAIKRGFSVAFPMSNGVALAVSTAPNPYTTSAPVLAVVSGNTTTYSPASFYNPNTFQIFCAGPDRLWGLGGNFNPNATSGTKLSIVDPTNTNLTTGVDVKAASVVDEGLRKREHDNMTNFSSGRLD